ncbi:HD-GYP domain-containing protein [Sulfurimonas sp.]|uniref:HD-GYP domain-containing protein n=1 Tax=Sulfurimonas sp. TaxID=2022749 RepID=UPI003569E008
MITKVQKKLRYDVDFNKLDLELIEIDTVIPYNMYIRQDDGYVIIVKAGTLIDEKVYKILLGHNIYISRKDRGKENMQCKNILEYISAAKDDSNYCIKLLYKMNDKFFEKFLNSKNYNLDPEDVDGLVKSIVLLVRHNIGFVKDNMVNFRNDSDLAHHSLHVCIYAVNLGAVLGLNDQQLLDLGIAGYIQDLGLKKIDNSVVSKDSPLSKEEVESIHRHTILSVQIAQHNKIHRPDIIDAIRHHHENYDGSGYPDQLNSDHISKYAAILSICDVFDALTSVRPYREGKTSFEALTFMMKDPSMMHRFNHQYIKVFIRTLLK